MEHHKLNLKENTQLYFVQFEVCLYKLRFDRLSVSINPLNTKPSAFKPLKLFKQVTRNDVSRLSPVCHAI